MTNINMRTKHGHKCMLLQNPLIWENLKTKLDK